MIPRHQHNMLMAGNQTNQVTITNNKSNNSKFEQAGTELSHQFNRCLHFHKQKHQLIWVEVKMIFLPHPKLDFKSLLTQLLPFRVCLSFQFFSSRKTILNICHFSVLNCPGIKFQNFEMRPHFYIENLLVVQLLKKLN